MTREIMAATGKLGHVYHILNTHALPHSVTVQSVLRL